MKERVTDTVRMARRTRPQNIILDLDLDFPLDGCTTSFHHRLPVRLADTTARDAEVLHERPLDAGSTSPYALPVDGGFLPGFFKPSTKHTTEQYMQNNYFLQKKKPRQGLDASVS